MTPEQEALLDQIVREQCPICDMRYSRCECDTDEAINQQPNKEQLTNNEYLELMYAECEDCRFYGNRCHCRYEQEEQQ